MFGNRKLLRDGAQAQGLLIESDSDKIATNYGGSGAYDVKVQVTFDDGATETFDARLHVRDAGLLRLGATVPVRYDSADRTKIAVDEAQIRGERETGQRQRKEAFATVAETPLPSGPAEQLEALREQLKALDARGSELRRAGAPREQVGAWVAEREAVDARYRALRRQHPEWTPS